MTAAAAPPATLREGAILAARWSIERLHRPAAPELVWLGYAKPDVLTFDCLMCGDPGFKQGVVRALGRTVYLCPACASHQVHPPTLPEAPPVGLARRALLEAGMDTGGAADTAARALRGEAAGRLVDLACGLGLVVEMVRAQPGWEACGRDVGPLPALGAEVFEAPVAPWEAQDLHVALPAGETTVVLCDGAIDRSAEPLALLALVRERAPAARWSIATLDAGVLYGLGDGMAIRSLIERRVLLPSRPGLQRLLARAGLPAAAIEAEHGTLRADRPADAPGTVSDPGQIFDRWLDRRGRAAPADESARLGLRVAALERATERGDRAETRGLLAALTPALAAAGEAARTSGEALDTAALFAKAPTCSVRLLCAAGFAHVMAGGASTQALMCFELAASLARRVQALTSGPMPEEAERHWSARFHAAAIARAMGDAARAEAGFRAILEEAHGAPAASAWVARSRAELEAPAAASVKPRRAVRRAAAS